MTLERRGFLRLAALGAVLPWVASESDQGGVLKIRLRDHPNLATPQGALRVQPPGMKGPLDILVLPEGGYAAVWPVCTHNGCQVRPEGWELFCPCHGSIFARDGRVLSGPALKPLRRLPLVETASGELHITLQEL